ncbi:Zn-dependent alcohol dehydrogenase [Marivibrio halodurans]|uniref:Zn-dependent alcohol dehydrogenase n=1 Tax=Marivibrio halodurans TaxID=2039722 RepID=A0A8J7SKQ9_9PROT|nr:Zn-dependent alcohol dehydrogenase [Marivibrio halodurans]MBP5858638.1 Zn-dependent alcohol dehydrogenase [Marivibrio halodurans]
MREIDAAVCRAFGEPLTIERVRLADPGPGEVLVRLKACAICHSDILFAEGAWGGDLPAVYGHEAAGIVEAVGDGVERLRPGDHAVVTLIRSCGHCHYCGQGRHTACETEFPLDRETPLHGGAAGEEALIHGLRTGGFAEYVTVDASQAVVIPDDVPLDSASLLACGVITGYGAVTNTARLRPGETTAVIGCGGVGLNTVQGAALSGASAVIALDTVEEKRAAALRFGAGAAIDAAAKDAVEQVRALTGGRGVDYAFVTVGVKPAIDQAMRLIGKTGAVVLVGMPPSGVFAEIDPGTLAAYSQRILGSKMGEARVAVDIPALVAQYRAGRLKLDELISNRYPLARINEAIAEVRAGRVLRNVIVFD